MGNPVLTMMTMEQAQEKQFQLTAAIAEEFSGNEFFQKGDVGVVPELGRPQQTKKVERVLARLFQVEACALVRGAGTGAIRAALSVLVEPGDWIMMHSSPIYQTTKETVRMMGLRPVFVDYNDLNRLSDALRTHRACRLFYVQHSRQHPDDHYDLAAVIEQVKKERPDLPIVVDDNYTVMKVPRSGVELGAAYSCFSGFKLLGPPGIGIVVGRRDGIEKIHQRNYSGGGQVQGDEAMDLLRSLVLAPVAFALQNVQTDRLNTLLNEGVIPEVHKAYVTNSQSKNVIVEFKKPIAPQVIRACEKYGAAVYPVGAESRYEVLPMIYRLSGSFLESRPDLAKTGIRINPMRSSADLTVKILKKALAEITARGKASCSYESR